MAPAATHEVLLWATLALAAAYGVGLAILARAGRRHPVVQQIWARRRPLIYSLSLGTYLSAWTVLGAPGAIAEAGWRALAIIAGPAIAFAFGMPAMRKIAEVCARENIASIADFLGARYGRSRGVAALAAIMAVAAALPYLALQLRALGLGFEALAGEAAAAGEVVRPSSAVTGVIAAAFAVFTIAICSRPAATHPDRGLVLAVATDGVVKLVALGVAGLAVVWAIVAGDVTPAPPPFMGDALSGSFITSLLLAMAALMCLPRQFHVAFIERPAADDLDAARWMFPAYVAATTLAAAALALLPGFGAHPDVFALAAPLAQGDMVTTALVALAGASAALMMTAVAAIALSAMITNDLILPALLRLDQFDARGHAGMERMMFAMRRGVIAALMLAAWAVHELCAGAARLADLGFVALAAGVQFAPLILAGVYWRGGRAAGAKFGLAAGLCLWAYTLALPLVVGETALAATGLTTALGGALDPRALFGVHGLDPLTHGVVWSLGVNTLLFVGVSRLRPASLRGRVQAAAFVGGAAPVRLDNHAWADSHATAHDLMTLAERYLGVEAARAAFQDHERETGGAIRPAAPAGLALARYTERLLAGALGASTARVIVASALAGGVVRIEQAIALLDQAANEAEFNRDLVQVTLESISQGVSVVDKDMRLVAWNSTYTRLFDFPPGFLYVGKPIAEVIRFNAVRGECGPGEVDNHVAKRLSYMREGSSHQYERTRPNGMALKTLGNPMPGGGYVTTFTDITEDKKKARALALANESLEQRVAARTAELERVAHELEAAKRAAETANAGKTAFLAAASHDLLQPLNAARLFTGALAQELAQADPGGSPRSRELAQNIERSIGSADRLLRGLLDISKLDQGGIHPKIAPLPLVGLFAELETEFAPMAAARGLTFRCAPTSLCVRADAALLRSVVQNFLSNALRYTEQGGVVLGARRVGATHVRVVVSDTGPGIPESRLNEVFREFRRLHDVDTAGEAGAGLGLAIVERIARLLKAPVSARSRVGRGSSFSITLPRAPTVALTLQNGTGALSGPALEGVRVLFVDDAPDIRAAMGALLRGWGCEASCVATIDQALAAVSSEERYDAVLADYHLGGGRNGLSVLDHVASLSHPLAARARPRLALLTADQSQRVEVAARNRGYALLRKPVDPDALCELLQDRA